MIEMDIERIARITNILRTKFPIDIVVKIMKEPTQSYMLTIEDQYYGEPEIYVRNTKNDIIKFLRDVYSFRHENHKEQIIKDLEIKNNSHYYENRYVEFIIQEIKFN